MVGESTPNILDDKDSKGSHKTGEAFVNKDKLDVLKWSIKEHSLL